MLRFCGGITVAQKSHPLQAQAPTHKVCIKVQHYLAFLHKKDCGQPFNPDFLEEKGWPQDFKNINFFNKRHHAT